MYGAIVCMYVYVCVSQVQIDSSGLLKVLHLIKLQPPQDPHTQRHYTHAGVSVYACASVCVCVCCADLSARVFLQGAHILSL